MINNYVEKDDDDDDDDDEDYDYLLCGTSLSQDECTSECFKDAEHDCYSWECDNCGCGCKCQSYEYLCSCDGLDSSCCYLIWNWLSSCCESEITQNE